MAAALMELFSLLPQASHFVESLVKHTIRLESALPRYKPCHSISPFRAPLAKYLNRHCASEYCIFIFYYEIYTLNELTSSIIIRNQALLGSSWKDIVLVTHCIAVYSKIC